MRELGQIISIYVIQNVDKNVLILESGKLSIILYLINTRLAEIMATNGSDM